MKKTSAAFLGLSLALAGGLALAQETMGGMDMAAMGMSMESMADEGMKPFMAPMDTMMASMPMTSSGMPDADFLLMMIPHHQSAIDMARVELEMGTDEETRAMAQLIIETQEGEIAEMRAMLERMGVEPPAAPAE